MANNVKKEPTDADDQMDVADDVARPITKILSTIMDYDKGEQMPDGSASKTTYVDMYKKLGTLANKGAQTLLLNRKSNRSESSFDQIKEACPGANILNVECDLQSFESVKNAADDGSPGTFILIGLSFFLLTISIIFFLFPLILITLLFLDKMFSV